MTPHSVLLGLMGESPETVQVGRLAKVMDEVGAVGEIELGLPDGTKRVKFDLKRDLVSSAGMRPQTTVWLIADMAFEPFTRPSERTAIYSLQRSGRYVGHERVFLRWRWIRCESRLPPLFDTPLTSGERSDTNRYRKPVLPRN